MLNQKLKQIGSTPNRQAGFAATETILVLIIIGLVGFIGYYVYSVNNKTSDIYSAASDSSHTQSYGKKKSAGTSSATPGSRLQSEATASDPSDNRSDQDMTDAATSLTEY